MLDPSLLKINAKIDLFGEAAIGSAEKQPFKE